MHVRLKLTMQERALCLGSRSSAEIITMITKAAVFCITAARTQKEREEDVLQV